MFTLYSHLTDKTKGPKGMSAFIVEKGTPGVIVGENIQRMGIRAASNVELAFVDCKIPAENLLGKRRQRLRNRYGRSCRRTYRYRCSGNRYCSGCFKRSYQILQRKKQFGKPLSSFQHTQFSVLKCRQELMPLVS